MQPMIDSRPFRRAALALLMAAALPGCAIFRTPPPLTVESAYAQGMEAYNAGRHRRAVELLGQFVTNAGADPRLKGALMALGRSNLEIRDYVAATSQFLRVATEFPRDPEAQDARFGLCDAYHRLSPRPQLDPEYTQAAITYCESFASIYPGTPQAGQAQQWVVEMRGKLAEKAYQNGFFYFRRGLYDAAVVYFNDVLAQFPETPWASAALARQVDAYGRMGYKEEEAAARARLLRDYPQSPEARNLAAAPADSAGR
ncbi:MAG TPA: outer membrane protein assembly factor BamD [Longimicrobium sp.]|nr:outer membrane protein assembly factor BamD [Longimicrobium sp.]